MNYAKTLKDLNRYKRILKLKPKLIKIANQQRISFLRQLQKLIISHLKYINYKQIL